MPKTVFQRMVFTFFVVLLMSATMATFNKYLVYGEFSPFLFRQVAVSFCQKAPLAFILQFFFVKKFAGRRRSIPQTTSFYISTSAPASRC